MKIKERNIIKWHLQQVIVFIKLKSKNREDYKTSKYSNLHTLISGVLHFQVWQWLLWDKTANKVTNDQQQPGTRYFFAMSSIYVNLKWNRIEQLRHKCHDVSWNYYKSNQASIVTGVLSFPSLPHPLFLFLLFFFSFSQSLTG